MQNKLLGKILWRYELQIW